MYYTQYVTSSGRDGNDLWLRTNLHAPRYRIVKIRVNIIHLLYQGNDKIREKEQGVFEEDSYLPSLHTPYSNGNETGMNELSTRSLHSTPTRNNNNNHTYSENKGGIGGNNEEIIRRPFSNPSLQEMLATTITTSFLTTPQTGTAAVRPSIYTSYSIVSSTFSLGLLQECIPMDNGRGGDLYVLESAAVASENVLVLKYYSPIDGSHDIVLYDIKGVMYQDRITLNRMTDGEEEDEYENENLWDYAEKGGYGDGTIGEKGGGTELYGRCLDELNTREVCLYPPLLPLATLPHPPHGAISGPTCSAYSNDIFYRFTNFSEPCSIYRTVVQRRLTDNSVELAFDQVYSASNKAIDPTMFETKKEFYYGSNGRKVSILIFGSIDALNTKNRPCILHVREWFSTPLIPMFSPEVFTFVKYYDGLFCVVDLAASIATWEFAGSNNQPSPTATTNHSSHTSTTNESTSGKITTSKSTYSHATFSAVEDMKLAAEYLLGVSGYCAAGQLGVYAGMLS